MLPAVTLVRCCAPRAGTASYVAVRAAETVGVLALGAFTGSAPPGIDPADIDINTMPWDTLPGIKRLAALQMEGTAPRTVILIGTTVAGRWTRWNPPTPPPPVPAITR